MATTPDGKEITFKFSNRELPINAWDVVLQVVYRGQLGSESDAVVVATRDDPAIVDIVHRFATESSPVVHLGWTDLARQSLVGGRDVVDQVACASEAWKSAVCEAMNCSFSASLAIR